MEVFKLGYLRGFKGLGKEYIWLLKHVWDYIVISDMRIVEFHDLFLVF